MGLFAFLQKCQNVNDTFKVSCGQPYKPFLEEISKIEISSLGLVVMGEDSRSKCPSLYCLFEETESK